jgi:pilus assembly protein TadC
MRWLASIATVMALLGAALVLVAAAAAVRRGRHRRPRGRRTAASSRSALLLPLLIAPAVAVTVTGVRGVISAAIAALVGRQVIVVAARRDRSALVAAASEDLPFLADLLAAVLRAGVTVPAAAGIVGATVGGPLADRLLRVCRAVSLGADPEEAWGQLADVPAAARLVEAAARAGDSGAALAVAFSRFAEEARTVRDHTADAAAERLGVLAVLPLGVCFLPAFVLVGVVPVVMAVLTGVLSLTGP